MGAKRINETNVEKPYQPTVHEHIIPVMVLKRHASQIRKPSRKSKIWEYTNGESKEVYISDICCKDNFYELFDGTEFIRRNYLENQLEKLEAKTSVVFDKLERQHSLSEAEKDNLYLYVALQMLRTPEIIEGCTHFLSFIQRKDKDIKLDNITRIMCLDYSRDTAFIELVLEMLHRYNLYCFHTELSLSICEECPVFSMKMYDNDHFPEFFTFPFGRYNYLLFTFGEFANFYNEADKEKTIFTNRMSSIIGKTVYSAIPYVQICDSFSFRPFKSKKTDN